MEKRAFKDRIYASVAGMTKAFGHGNRLEILDLLANGEKTVEQVAAQTAISFANASRHLQVLKQARLVSARRSGHHLYYSLLGPHAYGAWKALLTLALEQEPVVQLTLRHYRQSVGAPHGITLATLSTLEHPYLVDVRPIDEFAAGSLPGAVSIPIGELAGQLAALPRDRPIVAYCRGVFCTFADEAVQLLRAHGFDAVRLAEGYPDLRFHTAAAPDSGAVPGLTDNPLPT